MTGNPENNATAVLAGHAPDWFLLALDYLPTSNLIITPGLSIFTNFGRIVRRPRRMKAEPVGFLDELHGERDPRTGETDAETESHDASFRGQICAAPPSTNSSAPSTKLASSEARKTTALAISSAVPTRPSGVVAAACAVKPAICSSVIRVL